MNAQLPHRCPWTGVRDVNVDAMPYRHILEYVDGTYDVGSTWHVLERAQQHNDGLGSTYTDGRLPVELVNCEEYPSFAQAFGREQQVQGWSRRKRRALIEG
jgi:putative endonuclease